MPLPLDRKAQWQERRRGKFVLEKQRIFIVGAGAMGEAMVKGLLSAHLVTPEQITVTNRQRAERLAALQHTYGIQVSHDALREIAESDIILLATKPSDLVPAFRHLVPALTARHLVISLAAGVTTASLEDCLEEPVPLIRAMPNASCAVLESATAICPGQWARSQHLQMAGSIFEAIGTSVVIEEALMDAVTGLSGSGPAYFYYVIEALLQGGINCGISRETSWALLLQTMLGAATMLKETGKEPSELRRQVTSPNGTTMAGIAVLDQANVQQLIVQAVEKATARATEMGRSARSEEIKVQ